MDAGHWADDTVCTGKTPVTGCGGDRLIPPEDGEMGRYYYNIRHGHCTAISV